MIIPGCFAENRLLSGSIFTQAREALARRPPLSLSLRRTLLEIWLHNGRGCSRASHRVKLQLYEGTRQRLEMIGP